MLNDVAKIAVVTGGSKGIGEAIVKRLTADGYGVIFTYNNSENRAREIISECNGNAIAYKVNLAEKESIENFLTEITNNYKHLIYGVVLNAGLKRDGFLPMMSDDDWSEVVDVNYKNNVTAHPSLKSVSPFKA